MKWHETPDGKGAVLYRKLPRHPCWYESDLWVAEYWDLSWDFLPAGNAVVAMTQDYPPLVMYVHTLDHFRRQGIATALMEAVKNRWPDAQRTDGISESENAFIESLDSDAPRPIWAKHVTEDAR